MKKITTTLLLSLLFLCSCSKQVTQKNSDLIKIDENAINAANLVVDANGLSQLEAVIKTVHGNIVFKFYPKHAPNTVTRIIELIQKEFYNGLIFHRVIPNFVIQGGDPTGTGRGGSGVNLKAEFNSLQHTLGTVAMARAQDKDSADSQFYIALTTLPHLDGKYTIFGQVISGVNLLPKITQDEKILSISLRNKNNKTVIGQTAD